jgi:hypothetical protein
MVSAKGPLKTPDLGAGPLVGGFAGDIYLSHNVYYGKLYIIFCFQWLMVLLS